MAGGLSFADCSHKLAVGIRQQPRQFISDCGVDIYFSARAAKESRCRRGNVIAAQWSKASKGEATNRSVQQSIGSVCEILEVLGCRADHDIALGLDLEYRKAALHQAAGGEAEQSV